MNSKLIAARLIAVLLLVIPGFAATYGFLEIKNAIFDYVAAHGDDEIIKPTFGWLKLIKGLIFFGCGAGFIGGWIFYRDKKRNYVAPRFRKKRPRPQNNSDG